MHLFQQFGIAGIPSDTPHQRIGLQFGCAGVALTNGTVHPMKCFFGFSPKCVGLGNLIGGVILMGGDEFFQCFIGFVTISERLA